jgi:hypothetical protein
MASSDELIDGNNGVTFRCGATGIAARMGRPPFCMRPFQHWSNAHNGAVALVASVRCVVPGATAI